MSFLKKTWLARIGVGLNRFRMNNSTDVVLESNPISVTQQGDQLSADNMNNLETRIGNAFDEMAGNLAPIEVSPASTNHAVDSQIVYNGILYKVTTAISTGDNLVVGTNITKYPVSSAISDISDYEIIPITARGTAVPYQQNYILKFKILNRTIFYVSFSARGFASESIYGTYDSTKMSGAFITAGACSSTGNWPTCTIYFDNGSIKVLSSVTVGQNIACSAVFIV